MGLFELLGSRLARLFLVLDAAHDGSWGDYVFAEGRNWIRPESLVLDI